MNILNFEGFEISSIDQIKELQKEVMVAFEPDLEKRIEEFDIDIFEDQMLLKDFLLTRTVEELTEASIALKADHFEHYKEELVDSFNFLVESAILLGYPIPEKTSKPFVTHTEGEFLEWANNFKHSVHNTIRQHIFDTIEAIGLCTNKLKLRPWRNSQYPVDLLTFKDCYKDIWNQFYILLDYSAVTIESLLTVWSKKYQVNKFRIESNY